ncbi:MAG TPA: (2Fe-2S)-binding protein, partial [Burkholderiaceae bacterium]|nr:(2Fe-2S)-binding protein [Burkholderiaceae bacterium]
LGQPTRSDVELATADGARYAWRGGVGAGRSVVAFSAICAHQLAYPTRDISFISYRDAAGPVDRRARVIHCCAEHSQYDPADGGRVLGGPATQPLAAILLEHDPATDELTAIGTQGGEMFDAFFAKYEFRLAMEHGGRARQPSEPTEVVVPLEQYCRQQVRC